MGDISFEEIDEVKDAAKGTFVPTLDDKKAFNLFKLIEVSRIIISILCILIGVVLIIIDSHIAIRIGTITYKESSISDVSVNLGALLCAIGLFFSYLSAKYLKIGDK